MSMAVRRCEFCTEKLPADARSTRKFCDDDCRRGRSKAPTVEELAEAGSLVEATEESITEARSKGQLGLLDAGAVAALRVLADKIDTEAKRWEYAFEWAQLNPGAKGGPKPPVNDNVSIPTYLRFLESLGLTPAGRGRLASGDPDEGGGGGDDIDDLAEGVPKPAPKK